MAQLKDNVHRSEQATLWIKIASYYAILEMLFNVYKVYFSYQVQNYTSTPGQIEVMRLIDSIHPILNLTIFVITATVFIQWFRRAYFNLHLLVSNLKNSEGMAAGAWFIPIYNYFGPYQIARELVEKTKVLLHGKIDEREQNHVNSWWTFWILSIVISFIGSFIVSLYKTSINSYLTFIYLEILSSLCLALSGYFLIKFIGYYSRLETYLIEDKNSHNEFSISNTNLLDS